jgi:hypothetical protein
MIAQLLPLALALLRHRFPHLLDHPALLAHTVYQTVVFDEAVRQLGFRYGRTWKVVCARQRQRRQQQERTGKGGRQEHEENEEWVGLTEQVLSTADWYDRWLAGEKKCEFPFFRRQAARLGTLKLPSTWPVAEDQFNEIISSEEAWMIVPLDSTASGMEDDVDDHNGVAAEAKYRPTMGARKVKALIEQVAGTLFWITHGQRVT